MTGPLYPQAKPEDHLTDRDIELLYFFINRKDLTKLKLDDVSIPLSNSLYSLQARSLFIER